MDWGVSSDDRSPPRATIIAPPPTPTGYDEPQRPRHHHNGSAIDDRFTTANPLGFMTMETERPPGTPLYPQVSRSAENVRAGAQAGSGDWYGSGIRVTTDTQGPSIPPLKNCLGCGVPCQPLSECGLAACSWECNYDLASKILSTGCVKVEQSGSEFNTQHNLLQEKDEEITALKNMIDNLAAAVNHAKAITVSNTGRYQPSNHSRQQPKHVQIILFQAGREPSVHMVYSEQPLSVIVDWYAKKTDQSTKHLHVVRRTGSRVGQFVLPDKEILHLHTDDDQGHAKYKAFEIITFEHLLSPGQKTQCSVAESSVGSPSKRTNEWGTWDERKQNAWDHSRSSSVSSSDTTGSQWSIGVSGDWSNNKRKVRKNSGGRGSGGEEAESDSDAWGNASIYSDKNDRGWNDKRKPGRATRADWD